jgi:hypothetical protein
MTGSTKNVKLGTCNVFFGGEDLGLTKGGVEVAVASTTHEVTVDQFGSTPIGEIITGRTVSAMVPLAETTLDNLLKIMPGSTLTTDGSFATGTVTFSTAPPTNGNTITIAGTKLTFKTNPVSDVEIAIPADIDAAGKALSDTVNGLVMPVYATYSGGVVTITSEQRNVSGNVTITSAGTNIAVTGLTGGVTPTFAFVNVTTGVSLNLLDYSKELRLRPKGTTGEDDFVILAAACPGALTFSFNLDSERLYNASFKGYAADNGDLFRVGEIGTFGDTA